MKFWLPIVLFLQIIGQMFLSVFSVAEGAAWADIRTVRVGVINNREQRDDFAYQLLLGYLRDYLDEVSKQTHWQYEYFSGDREECMRRLSDGELDFVAPIRVADVGEKMFLSHGFSCYTALGLYKYLDASSLEPKAEKMNKAVIGILDDEEDERVISHYLSKHEWKSRLRKFSSPPEMLAALHAGEIDAVLDDGANVTSKERRMVDIGMVSAQFITTAAKAELGKLLTDSISTIETVNPGFETEMEAQYLDRALQYIVSLTEAEQEFMAKVPTLKVAFLPSVPPLFEVSEESALGRGNYIDILNMLSSVSGMQFEAVAVKSQSELHEMLDQGEVDMAFVVYTNDVSPLEMYYTNDLVQEEFTLVRLAENKPDSKGRGFAAVPVCFMGAPEFFEKRFPFTARTYATVEDCLDAVEEGRCEVAVVPSLHLQRYNSLVLRPSLKEADGERVNLPVSMAVSPMQSPLLQQVINKMALKLDRDQLEKSARENAKPLFSIGFILHQYPVQTAVFLCLFLVAGSAAALIWYRGSMQKRQNIALQQKNKELEVALANVESMRIARDGYKLESEMDKLTGLLNKVATERLAHERLVNMAEGTMAALYIIDLDHFKEANDTYGHQVGDVILKDFAAKLKALFRTGDCVGRFGGDEFVVLICGLPDNSVIIRKAKQILTLARSIAVPGKDVHITASVGIAIVSRPGHEYNEIFHAADNSLYRVKKAGRDGYAIGEGEVEH